MNRTEYIGKLNALYVGEKNCLEELITAYDEKDKEIEKLQRQKEELQVNGLRQETLFKLKIEKLNNDYLEMKDNFRVANDEIERLNNIINELEKYIDEDDWTSVNGEIAVRLIKSKLQELKGSDKDENK